MALEQCPICQSWLSAPHGLEKHVNAHLDEEECARDRLVAQQIASDMDGETSTSGALRVPFVGTSTHNGTQMSNFSLGTLFEPAFQLQIKENFVLVEEGIMPLLKKCLESEQHGCTYSLLTDHVDHFHSLPDEDLGWGCGWRNIQMLSSHLLAKDVDAKNALFGGIGFVPNIPSLQRWLEYAWNSGFDVAGAEQFQWKVRGSQKWIGTTECAALLRSFRIHAQVVDFKDVSGTKKMQKNISKGIHKKKQQQAKLNLHWNVQCDVCGMYPIRGTRFKCIARKDFDLCARCMAEQVNILEGAENQYEKIDTSVACSSDPTDTGIDMGSENCRQHLVDWVWKYFNDGVAMVSGTNLGVQVVTSRRPPLYFQHQGHSRTIVGIQRRKHQLSAEDEVFMLILDPSQTTQELVSALRTKSGWQKLIKRGVHTLRKTEYQLCFVEPGLADIEEMERLKIIHPVSH